MNRDTKRFSLPKKSKGFFSAENFKVIIVAIAIAIIIRGLVFEIFSIPSGSMKSSLTIGDNVFVSKFSYGYGPFSTIIPLHFMKERVFFTPPKRGDIVVFRSPYDDDPKKFYIKRVIGIPGDKVQLKDGIVFVNDAPLGQKPAGEYSDIKEENGGGITVKLNKYIERNQDGVEYYVLYEKDFIKGNFPNTTPVYNVPNKFYFFMGDNRNHSIDSRYTKNGIGYVHELRLVGRTNLILWNAANPITNIFSNGRFLKEINDIEKV